MSNKHNPNPFDFVPFQDKPSLYNPRELDESGELLSGYLEVTMKTLTPMHVVGSLRLNNDRDNQSKMYLQDGDPCVPASTVRGCLRAFIEALTNGWASQATDEYEKVQGIFRKQEGRHIGYKTFENYETSYDFKGKRRTRNADPALSSEFDPSQSTKTKDMFDIASYLFGIVIEPQDNKQTDHKDNARKGKVYIEDVFFSGQSLNKDTYWYPDLKHTAFMGGGKPSKSNWWYFQPAEVRKRSTTIQTRNGEMELHLAEFVGGTYWGRKFYYHQDPVQCTKFYGPNGQWHYDNDRPFERVNMECIERGVGSESFRIYVDRLPKTLLQLLVLALVPGETIRHKLGYGKAYGYGSVEFTVSRARLREVDSVNRVPEELEDWGPIISEWQEAGWATAVAESSELSKWVDQDALKHLAQVCGWLDIGKINFTYPPYNVGKRNDHRQFQNAIQFRDLPKEVSSKGNKIILSSEKAFELAKELFKKKKPIHFRLYQERSKGWDLIEARKP